MQDFLTDKLFYHHVLLLMCAFNLDKKVLVFLKYPDAEQIQICHLYSAIYQQLQNLD